jgi:hypothetical protein
MPIVCVHIADKGEVLLLCIAQQSPSLFLMKNSVPVDLQPVQAV